MFKIIPTLTLFAFNFCFASSDAVPFRALTQVAYTEDLTTITLDDGSVWETKDYPSCAEAALWSVNDPILIYPSKDIFVKEEYSLYNEQLRTFSHVNLLSTSKSNLPTFLSISNVNYDKNIITIENVSKEKIHFEVTSSKLENWRVGDAIILGWNKDMGAGSDLKFPYILINTPNKNFLKASYIQSI